MNIAFCLFKYFPYGGLQNDMILIADEALAHGHRVVIFTGEWHGERPSDIPVRILPLRSWTNHGKAKEFEKLFHQAVQKEHFDLTVAFNRMAGCDFYFAADNCQAVEYSQKHSPLALLLPRYRTYLDMEARIFAPESRTEILYITPRQKKEYRSVYETPEARFHFLPPGLKKSFIGMDWALLRTEKRAKLGLKPDDRMLIQIASNFSAKGGDRFLRAVASLPESWKSRCKIFCIGAKGTKKEIAFAKKLGLSEDHFFFPGARSDANEYLAAADLMVHPARTECAGNVLTEAIVSGTPVVCTGACGFSNYVTESGGFVLKEPFRQEAFNALLLDALENLTVLRDKVVQYAEVADFYRRSEVAVTCMVQAYERKKNESL